MLRSFLAMTLLALLTTGCATTRAPERFPGLGAEGISDRSLGLIREADNIYVERVDEKFITQYDLNYIAIATYRQHLLPPGKHTLAVFYRQQRNLETLAAGPRFITFDVQPGHDYVLKSNLNGADVLFTDLLPTANWRPAVIDAHTHETVALAPINR